MDKQMHQQQADTLARREAMDRPVVVIRKY